jgi:hypothetical protein
MFFEVVLHVMSHKLITHNWRFEFYNMHENGVNNALSLMGASYPLFRVGSLFLPFAFIDFQWTPLLVACFLISLSS